MGARVVKRVVELGPTERGRLADLFATHQRDRVLIDSTLEGHFGLAFVDRRQHPTVARLVSGEFTLLGGDPKADQVIDLLRCAPIVYVTPENQVWRDVLEREFAGRIQTLTFTEYLPHRLDALHLARLSVRVTPDYLIERVDSVLVERVEKELGNAALLENFNSPADFASRGIGFCALFEGRVVAAAGSMAASSRAVDVEIETAVEHRGRGLATALSARLALACLARGLVPYWLAANPASERLARRLGYTAGGTYETLAIQPS
jgi:GNAT superfamily N-acetyltransferase